MKIKKILAAAAALCLTFSAAPIGITLAKESLSAVAGDLNGDGIFNLSDMVMFQRWLRGVGQITSAENADLNNDGRFDIFDLCAIRKLLIKGITAAPEQKYAPDSRNLCAGIASSESKGLPIDSTFIDSRTKFTVDLFKNSYSEGENNLISPYSVMQALAMTTNGANGQTREEMETALGGIPIEELNRYLLTERLNSANTQKNAKDKWLLNTANSIWARNDESRIRVRPEFLQNCVDYYNSEYFVAPFDNTTLNDVNGWINDKTNGMIPKVLDNIYPDDVMYLVNAVAFEAEWAEQYEEHSISDGKFTAADGKVQDAKMLRGLEKYIGDENTDGIIKYYSGYKYAFAAMLPEEGMTVDEYIAKLSPEKLNSLLTSETEAMADCKLPKFRYEYRNELSDELKKMGMSTPFEAAADFSQMNSADNNIFISAVIHDTFIELSETGTKAAAATVVATKDTCIFVPDEMKEVVFDRPFVYCIFDTETSLPIFIGALNSLE